MALNAMANDAMIRRLQLELEERNAFVQGIITSAQEGERDLNDTEQATIAEARNRMGSLKTQLDQLEDTARVASEVAQRVRAVDQAITDARGRTMSGPVEYRSAGEYVLDLREAQLGNRESAERIEMFHRAADHVKTGDAAGIIPDPIVGELINFVDATRPIVSFLGPRNLPSASWHRPKVTQQPTVGTQGAAGAAVDEKTELVSQKMIVGKLTGEAVTYGGYANVSRQLVDFSTADAINVVINALAEQYAVETEAAAGAALAATGTTAVGYGASPDKDTVATAVWQAAGVAYTAVKGRGRLGIALAPDVLPVFGPLFAPVNPRDSQSPGLNAVNFGQGPLGTISGIPVLMSAGLGAGEAFLFSTSALEPYERRVGALQVVEPSVLGMQVAYAGYFTPMTIEEGAIVPLTAT